MSESQELSKTGYFADTRSFAVSALIALPLLVGYEIGIYLLNIGKTFYVVNAADAWITRIITLDGLIPELYSAFVIGAVLIAAIVHHFRRQEHIEFKKRYFPQVIGESALWAVILAPISFWILSLGQHFRLPRISAPDLSNVIESVVHSFGAGFYEELFFRVIVIGILIGLLSLTKLSTTTKYIIAALIAAAIFSGVHHLGPLGDPFSWDIFAFRFMMGLPLNALYLARGFAVAAWSHAIYDIYVMLGILA